LASGPGGWRRGRLAGAAEGAAGETAGAGASLAVGTTAAVVAIDHLDHARGLEPPGGVDARLERAAIHGEQVISAAEVDHRCDLWALGVVAYESLTGDIPFAGETLGSVCVAICNGDFAPPSRLRKGVGPEVDAWFAKVFARNPAERFQSISEQAAAFRAALLAGDGWQVDDELSGEHPAPPLKETTKVGLGPAERNSVEVAVSSSSLPVIPASPRARFNAPTEVERRASAPALEEATPAPRERDTQPSSQPLPRARPWSRYAASVALVCAAASALGLAMRPATGDPRLAPALRAAAPPLQLTARLEPPGDARPVASDYEPDEPSVDDVPRRESAAAEAAPETNPHATPRPRADYGF
jgi:hypothetical protein